ncbi:hypothetical protein XCR_4199 [Xanthomonas campestris pv. raphani 756C]|nr:hypothetical protein XCR_4199 [Xanthomonas campestris pv. raphani 756C]
MQHGVATTARRSGTRAAPTAFNDMRIKRPRCASCGVPAGMTPGATWLA